MTTRRSRQAPRPTSSAVSGTETIERTSIVTVALLEELHHALDGHPNQDDVTLGIVMGVAMFLDEQIGPFRTERLMRAAPGIVLESDAHVTALQRRRFEPVVKAFGEHIARRG